VERVALVFLKHDPFTLTLMGVAIVVVVARLAGQLFAWLHQPPVIGEVVAGIALGPMLLGDVSETLFPADGRPLLKMLATLGLVLFMFLVGLELDLQHLAGRTVLVTSVAVVGTVVPFGLGIALGGVLHPYHDNKPLLPFALFIGASMSITALPVLVRILRERGLQDTQLGAVATACAAGDDLMTWICLAAVVAIIGSSGGWELPYTLAAAVAFSLLMVKIVGPLLRRLTDAPLTDALLSATMAGILACSFVTSTIGVHEIFGAFLLGVVFPRGTCSEAIRTRLGSLTRFLLPIFFVTSGLSVDISADSDALWQLGLILLVACAGKVISVTATARVRGVALRESLALGVLMNTRGLTELIVLNIGLQLGVLDVQLFSALVVMAVITTVATSPLLAIIKPDPSLPVAARRRVRAATPDLELFLPDPMLPVPDHAPRWSRWRRGVLGGRSR
jgi:Kef-type K+ transport system membrane component KefB